MHGNGRVEVKFKVIIPSMSFSSFEEQNIFQENPSRSLSSFSLSLSLGFSEVWDNQNGVVRINLYSNGTLTKWLKCQILNFL